MRRAFRCSALIDQINLGHRFSGRTAFGLHQSQKAFHAHGPSAGSLGLAAQLLEQSVISPPTADGSLGTQFVRDPLKNREIVIVEPPDKARIDSISNSCVLEDILQGIEMLQ